jgi:predicted PurR-regulated permease PerM
MLTPISLIFGLFLTKITNRMITIFPLKITFIFFGCLGILLSVITSGFNKRLIRESYDLFKKKKKKKKFYYLLTLYLKLEEN